MNRMRINLEKGLTDDVRSSHNIGEVQSTVPNPTIPGIANVHNRQVSDSLPSVAQLPEVPDSSEGGFCSPLAVYRRASSLLHSRHKMRLRQPRTTRVANSPLPMPTSASRGQKKAHSAHSLHLLPSASLAGGVGCCCCSRSGMHATVSVSDHHHHPPWLCRAPCGCRTGLYVSEPRTWPALD